MVLVNGRAKFPCISILNYTGENQDIFVCFLLEHLEGIDCLAFHKISDDTDVQHILKI